MVTNETRRERIQHLLSISMDGLTPEQLAQQLTTKKRGRVTENDVLNDVNHIRQSLRHEQSTLLVQPPKCRDCGFDGFDNILGNPSKCPDCRSEWIRQPAFKIE